MDGNYKGIWKIPLINPEIIKDIPLSLTKDGLFRRMGYGGRNFTPAKEIIDEFDRAIDFVEGKNLLKGQSVIFIQEIVSILDQAAILRNGSKIFGERIFKLIPNATHIALAICTIGDEIESFSRAFVQKGDPLLGVMLDSIGSASVDCLVEETSRHIDNHARSLGLMSSSPISPGMPGLPIETQEIIFNHLPAEKINMRLTSNHMMIPFKSSSMMFGLGKEMPNWSKEKICKNCHLFKHCRYKIVK